MTPQQQQIWFEQDERRRVWDERLNYARDVFAFGCLLAAGLVWLLG